MIEAEFTAQADRWGNCVFGDLAVAVCRAVEIHGIRPLVAVAAASEEES